MSDELENRDEVTDEVMAKEAAQVTDEEFVAFAERTAKNLESAPLYSVRDIVLDGIMFVIVVAVAFGWMLLMLMIISFVSFGYLHFQFDYMLIAAAVCALLAAIVNAVRLTKKYTKLNEKTKLKREREAAIQGGHKRDESD